jgi:DNA polymerase-3 subunit delta
MRVDPEQLPQHLQRGLKPLYTVHGEETLLALEALDRIRRQARAGGYAEREVLSVESGFDWSQLYSAGHSLSLFGARRLLELRIPSGKPGVEGAEAIKRFCSELPPDTVSLVSLPKLDKATLTSGWFQALDAAGVTIAAQPIARNQLPQWLSSRLAQNGQEADQATLELLAGMVEGNLLAAQQEVQKLALLFPPGRLRADDVESAVMDVARYDVFKLGEAILAADRARLVRMLDGLRGEGVAPPLVLWAIVEEIRALWRVSRALSEGAPMPVALREAKVWGTRAELLPQAVRRVRPGEIRAALAEAARVDRIIKGIGRADPWVALAQLALRLVPDAGPRSGPAENRGRISPFR